METCQKFNDDPHSVSKAELDQVKNLAKSLTNNPDVMNELENTIKNLETCVSISKAILSSMLENNSIGEDFSSSGIGQIAAQELLEDRCKELGKDISHISVDDIHKLHAYESILLQKEALPQNFAITKNLGELSESYLKFRHQELQKNISNASIDDVLKLSSDCNSLDRLLIGDPPINKQDIQDLSQKFIRNQCQTFQKDIDNVSVDDILQLNTDCEKLQKCLPENFSFDKDLKSIAQDLINTRNMTLMVFIGNERPNERDKVLWSSNFLDKLRYAQSAVQSSFNRKTRLNRNENDLRQLGDDYNVLKGFFPKNFSIPDTVPKNAQALLEKELQQPLRRNNLLQLKSDYEKLANFLSENSSIPAAVSKAAQSYFDNVRQNPPTADSILQLESDFEQLKGLLPEDFSLQDVPQQAAQSYFDNTLQGLCEELSEEVTYTDTEKLEEAYDILQKYAPGSTISQEKIATLSSAIQSACQNVQKTEEELATASVAYSALPEETHNYNNLDASIGYNRTQEILKLNLNLITSNFVGGRGIQDALRILPDGFHRSTLERMINDITGQQEKLLDNLNALQETLKDEGINTPESLAMAIQNTHTKLGSLKEVLDSELSSLPLEKSDKPPMYTISENLAEGLNRI